MLLFVIFLLLLPVGTAILVWRRAGGGHRSRQWPEVHMGRRPRSSRHSEGPWCPILLA